MAEAAGFEPDYNDGYGKRTYFDGTVVPKTKEAEVMKELGLTRYCCKKVLLTHVDLIQKL